MWQHFPFPWSTFLSTGHFSSTSPNWLHSNTLHSCCLTPAFLSFPGLPALLSKSIFTLLGFTFCFVTLCSQRHLWLWLKELCLMISLRARVWVNKDILPCLWIVCMVSDKFRPVTRSVLSVHSHDIFHANVCLCLCVCILFPLSHHYLKIRSLIQDTRRSSHLWFTERKKERENHSNSFPSALTSSWDPEERLGALRPHESCLSYCFGRRRDGSYEALGMEV